ncbi:MAG: GSCFA domain-containing protein [Fibrobacter sp.]|nr:GSCFA domain-containing protein [Fibrobacter sp.]
MEFFTKIDIPRPDFTIDYTKKLAFFGSCFADNISAQFSSRKFQVLSNPFGTVYNPVSLAAQVRAIAEGKVFGEQDVFQDGCWKRGGQNGCEDRDQEYRRAQDARGPWHCWDAHGSLSGKTREECLGKLNAATAMARDFLQKADVVFITLGTAFVYYLKDSGKPVSNCHRQDPSLFTRRMISVDEAAEALAGIVNDLHTLNKKLHIVFTVSPLRHMADGAHQNSLSKATLQLAVDKIAKCGTEIATVASLPRNDIASRASAGVYSRICETQQSCASRNDNTHYFPSYEIVMDELRDYRFYADDNVHLSKTTEEYIFERMVDAYCSDATRENIARVEKFLKMANHRIVDATSPATAEFQKKLAAQAASLEKTILGLVLNAGN